MCYAQSSWESQGCGRDNHAIPPREPGHVRRYICFDRTWDTPDPRAAFFQRMKYAALAMFGLTEY